MKSPLLKVEGLEKRFAIKNAIFQKKQYVHAVSDLNLELYEKETVAIVGESGSGKSTMSRCILQLQKPTSGKVTLLGKKMTELNKREMKELRRNVQMVFQDPMSSMNPKLTIQEILSEPLIAHKINKNKRMNLIKETLALVGLSQDRLLKYPHEFSGGQRQRIGIGRALILRPKVIILDEPLSALDVSIQSQILNLLKDLQQEIGVSYIFISHDLGVVEQIADRVGVMYMGELVEVAANDKLFQNPLHPYTQALISSIPKSDPDEKKERIILKGEPPSPANPPAGCKFHTRCIHAMEICQTVKPKIVEMDGHEVSCHLYTNSIDNKHFTKEMGHDETIETKHTIPK